jgi:hypothetical protein
MHVRDGKIVEALGYVKAGLRQKGRAAFHRADFARVELAIEESSRLRQGDAS